MNEYDIFLLILGGFNNSNLNGAVDKDRYFRDVTTGAVYLHRSTPNYFLIRMGSAFYLHTSLNHKELISLYIEKFPVDTNP